MRIPKRFKLSGSDWRVEYKWKLVDEDGNEALGLCDYANRVIYLDRLESRDSKFATFFHEFIHAVLHEAHLTNSGLFHPGTEEIVCRALEERILESFNVRWKVSNE